MTRQELFDLVHVNTERKWEKLGTIASVFNDVTQDFCANSRFWWRQLLCQMNTVTGQGTYDLTADGVITNVDMGELKIEEMTNVMLVDAAQLAQSGGFGFDFGVDFGGGGGGVVSNSSKGDLIPVYDQIAQLGMIVNPQTMRPGRYFLGYNDDHTLVIDTPDNVYSLWLMFYAMPNIKADSTSAAIPLIPAQFHRVIRAGMEAYIWEHVYGASNPKYVIAKKNYDDGVLDAQSKPRFSTNYSQQLVSSDSAIRST